ncbi:uncharacterized protein LOC110451433 [Mizuhopecten yessoensis]|uniref:uncharacterized protein LOC110451433 n=1 Tax=Mizuhopecten yessoensis TaxID=6573 RepID=UPI000B457BE3|nr:uncharacterized protein LOC110451433 [Mizuhopecten yessoensis]
MTPPSPLPTLVRFASMSKGCTTRKFRNRELNLEAKTAISAKRRHWIKYLHCKTTENFVKYQKTRNIATKAVRKSKYHYEEDLAAKIKTNPKLFWTHVRSKTKVKSSIGRIQKPNGEFTIDNKDTADTLNNFFASVFVKDQDTPLPPLPRRNFHEPFVDIDIIEDSVIKAIKRINPTKSPGPDNLHSKLISETAEDLKKPLQIVFKKSLENSQLQTSWKEATVKPFFKKGSQKDPGNYRPISLTSVPSKTMQRLIRDEILTHMNTNIPQL